VGGLRLFRRRKVKRRSSGYAEAAFTLTETLVVLVIIGLIAAIVGPRLFNRLDDAKVRTARLQIANLVSAVDIFRTDTGRLPTKEEGLEVLIHSPTDGVEWLGPYLAKDHVPLDPWNHPYVYEADPQSGHFAVISYGADGKKGGEGSAKDLSSDDQGRRAVQPASTAEAPEAPAAPAAPTP